MNGKTRLGLCFISLSLFFLAGVLYLISEKTYRQNLTVIPAGSTLGGFEIGADLQTAEDQISAIYAAPVEMKYEDERVLASPDELGFSLDFSGVREALDAAIRDQSGKISPIDVLFRPVPSSEPIRLDLSVTVNAMAIRNYLTSEISPRYDRNAASRRPLSDGRGFCAGHDGTELDVEAAVPLIEAALRSPAERSVILPVKSVKEPAGDLINLEIILRSVIDGLQDKGQITEVWFSDPLTNQSFDIARRDRTDLAPEISFTAASTMKLPIMISSYARMDEEPNQLTKEQLRLMITESKNDQTDWMMENIVGGERAPLIVTEDMKKLGMKNSFLAGYFYLGAPLLALFDTEANSRTDIDLHPDVYNQTTAKDMGSLMRALYDCAETGEGLLPEVYGKEAVTKEECRAMIQLLKDNHLPYLISAGVPDTVEVAHKHGWIEENDGLLHTMGNIAAVYTPGGNYILSIYTYHPENLIFEEGSTLFAGISAAVYEYFNPSHDCAITEE